MKGGLTYNGLLAFGYQFYSATNDVPSLAGTGIVQQTTSFPISTGTGTGRTGPSRSLTFTGHTLNGGVPELTLSGPPGLTLSIERTASLTNPAWSPITTTVLDPTGVATFRERAGTVRFPAFYRARALVQ